MRLAMLMGIAMMSFSPVMSFAGEKCNCSQECMKQCEHGKGEKCTCKSGCKEGKKCKDGTCPHEHK